MRALAAAALLLCGSAAAVDPKRVHLIDAYPRQCPGGAGSCVRNYLFRGNNPVEDKVFNFTKLMTVIRGAASTGCGVTLPEDFTFVDLDLENPTDKGYFKEESYWKAHPEQGRVVNWPTLGSLVDPDPMTAAMRSKLVDSGSWAVEGSADHLDARLKETRAMLLNVTSKPVIMYAHCNAGCDRTGEFIGAYAMTYLGYNSTTMYGAGAEQCGRPPNYYATEALKWWCFTLQQKQGVSGLGDCTAFAGCKAFGDCNPHNATPPAHPCPF
eukprot:TRINITY_DN19717_c0_g1_i1.p2 TRINITY_DN19717_c0_g1~~TRINITY_DN19717_c0_g1_i1.p2  ORF type:complete len:291 (+),score=117.15 TRINITY_DN19717_c0_g1_i1:71-874(+)